MLLKKTKLAGIISLVLCTTAVASTTAIVVDNTGSQHDFGPFVSAMDTSNTTTSIATYTLKYAQKFSYDIGAPWTFSEYCIYNSDVCELYWDGTESKNGNDGLYVWRRNILNTFNNHNGAYESESTSSIDTIAVAPSNLVESRKVTAMDGTVPVGYGTTSGSITRQAYYNDTPLLPSFTSNGGFSAAHDVAEVSLTSSDGKNYIFAPNKLVVGQSSVRWANSDDSNRFSYCFNARIDDDRYDYSDLFNCPGFDLQASFWNADGSDLGYFSNNNATTWLSGGSSALFVANAYAINTAGFAVGFSSKEVNSSETGRARATIFKPTVQSDATLNYAMTEIVPPTDDDVIRDTIAIDITDSVYSAPTVSGDDGTFTLLATNTDAPLQAFIVVGNRTYNVAQNRSFATEFYTYDVKSGEVRYPFEATPIKGANSRVSKINNDGLAVGWRDSRGETSPTADGSPRFQSAFVYDYKNKKSAYLDDLYCKEINDGNISGDVRYRFSNAISITDNNNSDSYTIVANGFDYKNAENYKNRTGSSPVVLSMTVTKDELNAFDNSSQCPVKAEEDYERSGAGMGWFVLLPTMMLLFRRFKRD